MNNLHRTRRANGSPAIGDASFVPTSAEKFVNDSKVLDFGAGDGAAAGQELPGINHPASRTRRHSTS